MIATYLTVCIRKSFSPSFSTTAVMLTSLHFLHNLLSRRKKIAALKTAALKAFQSLAFGKKTFKKYCAQCSLFKVTSLDQKCIKREGTKLVCPKGDKDCGMDRMQDRQSKYKEHSKHFLEKKQAVYEVKGLLPEIEITQ